MSAAALLLAAALGAPVGAMDTPAASVTVAQAEKKKRGMVRRPVKKPSAEGAPKPAEETAAPAETGSGEEHGGPREMSPEAHAVKLNRALFRSDPVYTQAYDAAQQIEIYGGKRKLDAPRPLLELGYPLYQEGPIGESSTWLGEKNPVKQQFLVYGDYRLAGALNDDDIAGGDGETANGIAAMRLNLDVDWKITATERIHFLFRPFDRDGDFSRYEWQGAATPDGEDDQFAVNGNVIAGFLEGDLGAIAQGASGSYNQLDLPFAVGLIPLLFQNGVWLDDAFTGLAVTIPAMNSPRLDISNMDVTFFAAANEVSSAVLPGDTYHGRVAGVATFIERRGIYYEAGYGYLMDDRNLAADASFHSVTAAVTQRFGNWLSNSVRIVGSFGQEDQAGGVDANGVLLLVENSLVTRKPYTLVPYLNLFMGFDAPQSLARDPGAGGILKNTGLNFETDGLAGIPSLDATAAEAFGGALGLEYLFSLDQQLVVEVATVQRMAAAPADTSDYGLGLRYQIPFARRYILRFDAMGGRVNEGAPAAVTGVLAERDISGARLELRVKF